MVEIIISWKGAFSVWNDRRRFTVTDDESACDDENGNLASVRR